VGIKCREETSSSSRVSSRLELEPELELKTL